MEKLPGEQKLSEAKAFVSDSQNIDDLKLELCRSFNPEMLRDEKMLYFIKRIYAKFSKIRNTTTQYMSHLEAVQK